MKKVLLHLTLVFLITVLLVFFFFNFFLPIYTNKGETVSIPDLKGLTFNEATDIIHSKNINYEVNTDSGYNIDLKPMVVLQQHPKPGHLVKVNREVNLTLNARIPPEIQMPHLVDRDLAMAVDRIKSFDLKIGEITYKPFIAHNLVLSQSYNGEEIEEGEWIRKGSRIDLLVGRATGRSIVMPDLTGLKREEAEDIIKSNQLILGSIINARSTDNIVSRQKPEARKTIPEGAIVDIWIK